MLVLQLTIAALSPFAAVRALTNEIAASTALRIFGPLMLPDLSREITADTGRVPIVSFPAPVIVSSMVKSSLPVMGTTRFETCGGAAKIVCEAASRLETRHGCDDEEKTQCPHPEMKPEFLLEGIT